jgi:GTPase SAR1 family protein
MSRLIGLAGPAGCGKSTIAKTIVERTPSLTHSGFDEYDGAERHRFAGPIKAMLRALGLTEAQVDGDEKELPCALLGGETPRRAMQRLGDWGRAIDLDLWVNATMLRVDDDLAADKLVVIDDVRFDNEARAVKARGGIIVRLERDTTSIAATSGHASEVGVSSNLIDVIVPNQDTPEQVARFILTQLNRP